MKWRIFGLILGLVGSLMALACIGVVVWQNWAMHNYVPAPAVIVSSKLTADRNSGKSTHYYPHIDYRYQFDGKPYESQAITLYADWGDYASAKAVTTQFPAGAHATAYVDPTAPQNAMLVRTYAGLPYAAAIIAIWVWALGVALLMGWIKPTRRTMLAVPLGDWYLLVPTKNVKSRRRDALAALLLTGLPTIILVSHFLYVGKIARLSTIVFILLALGAVVIEVVWWIRMVSVSRHMSDPRIQLSAAPIPRGQPVRIRAEFDTRTPLTVESIRAIAVCIEQYHEVSGKRNAYGSRPFGSIPVDLGGAGTVLRGAIAAGEGELRLDPEKWPVTAPPPQGPAASHSFKYYRWELRIEIKLQEMTPYEGTFAVEVI